MWRESGFMVFEECQITLMIKLERVKNEVLLNKHWGCASHHSKHFFSWRNCMEYLMGKLLQKWANISNVLSSQNPMGKQDRFLFLFFLFSSFSCLAAKHCLSLPLIPLLLSSLFVSSAYVSVISSFAPSYPLSIFFCLLGVQYVFGDAGGLHPGP